jgi:GNAT superfamily N-acetyltransferase
VPPIDPEHGGVRVRPFRRDDREQLTALVNAHVGAVVPNVVVPVQTVLSRLESDPGEFVIDPWVRERATLVAEQRGRVVAAGHLIRYRDDPDVGPAYRGIGEIGWLLCWPEASYWPDAQSAGRALAAACTTLLDHWQVREQHADGALPAPAVFGVPEQWPHIRRLYEQAGFTQGDRVEQIWITDLSTGPRTPPRAPGGLELTAARRLGEAGTRFDAVATDGEMLGFVEVDATIGAGVRHSHLDGWADVGNLLVADGHRRRGVGRWLLAQGSAWLRLGGVHRLLAYTAPADPRGIAEAAFLQAVGFTPLTTTIRGYTRR